MYQFIFSLEKHSNKWLPYWFKEVQKRLSVFFHSIKLSLSSRCFQYYLLTVSTKNCFPNKKFKFDLSLKGSSEEIRLQLVTQALICWVILRLHSSVLVQLIFLDWYSLKSFRQNVCSAYGSNFAIRMILFMRSIKTDLLIRFAKQGKISNFDNKKKENQSLPFYTVCKELTSPIKTVRHNLGIQWSMYS